MVTQATAAEGLSSSSASFCSVSRKQHRTCARWYLATRLSEFT